MMTLVKLRLSSLVALVVLGLIKVHDIHSRRQLHINKLDLKIKRILNLEVKTDAERCPNRIRKEHNSSCNFRLAP